MLVLIIVEEETLGREVLHELGQLGGAGVGAVGDLEIARMLYDVLMFPAC